MAVGIVPNKTSTGPNTPELYRKLLMESVQEKANALKGLGGLAGDAVYFSLSKEGREALLSSDNSTASERKSGRNTSGTLSTEPFEALCKIADWLIGLLTGKRTEVYGGKASDSKQMPMPVDTEK